MQTTTTFFLFQFSIPTSADVKEIQQFLKKEFYPDEPICINSGITTDGSGGWFHRKMTEFMDKEVVTGYIKINLGDNVVYA